MKLSTRCLVLLAALLLPLASAFATTVTVTIGSNFYSPLTVNIQTGDVVHFVLQSGQHPTVSEDNTSIPLFTLSSASPTRDITFNTAGAIPYYCLAHGAPGQPLGQGMNGLINVTQRTTTATLDAKAAGIDVNVYPNPSHGQVTVQLNQKIGAGAYQLRLSNIIGQEVRTIALKPELTTAGLPLDLSDLRTGVYFYSLVVDGKVASTKRLVLQN
ncbi:T9SS type A sorting domain-containing protein [Microvirga sp. STS02]|uniref:T9SS type A sorting domain-containing protein n=1 Tax=Hymenobacter negativus TaxID=2795026 RepID=UPI0018DE01D7|nr:MULTISPECIES: T9SS type A sorting domain-containing protein [Bacteria]MBH8570053.1 T9SS type A sorting domain-containing protein [Hymenobacter negativus]MBR7209793.1 T9SS type A sorting domain-containing protein [Microvirga sp. STS02]